jgi:hypothetical protein
MKIYSKEESKMIQCFKIQENNQLIAKFIKIVISKITKKKIQMEFNITKVKTQDTMIIPFIYCKKN